MVIETALDGGRAWWIVPSTNSPTYAEVWSGLKERLGHVWVAKHEQGKRVDLPGGGSVTLKSADRPDTLRGTGLDLVVPDEFAIYREARYLWEEVLRPSLTDRVGGAIFPSTPKGRSNYFHELYRRGQGAFPEWSSWRFPSSANPFLPTAEIETAKTELLGDVFDQEYLAEFNDAGSSPFDIDNITAMTDGATGERPHVRGRQYRTAWDIGRRRDPTVGITVDYTETPYQIVSYERMERVPYPVQQDKIAEVARAYPGLPPVVESNGPGDPVVENLEVRAEPFVTTARSKAQAIQALQMLLERRAIKASVPQLTRELLAYEWDDKALVQDSVMALAILALHLPPPSHVRQAYIETAEGLNTTILGDYTELEL